MYELQIILLLYLSIFFCKMAFILLVIFSHLTLSIVRIIQTSWSQHWDANHLLKKVNSRLTLGLTTRTSVHQHANVSLTLNYWTHSHVELVWSRDVLATAHNTSFFTSLTSEECVVAPPSQSLDICCAPPSNFSKYPRLWHKQHLAGVRTRKREVEDIRRNHKHFFKAPLLLCYNLLLLFFLSLANQLRGKDWRLPN